MMKAKKITSYLLTAAMLTGVLTGCGTGAAEGGGAAAASSASGGGDAGTSAASGGGDGASAASDGGGAGASAVSDGGGAGTSAQSPGASAEGGKTAVSFWTHNTKQPALDTIVAEFNEANPDIEITVSYYDTDGMKDACKVAASSNTLPSIWFNWGGSLGGFYADNGLTYDLTAYAEAHDWDGVFDPGALNLCVRDGKLTGYPMSYNVLELYYRKDIFEQYQLSVPTTFEEFEKVCAVLKENGVTPISTAGLNGWHVMRFVELFIEHYAGAALHDQMNVFAESYDNETVVQALAKYKEFCDLGYFPDGFLTANPDDTKMAIYSGMAAMDIQGPWYDGFIVQDGQDINNYGTFAFPSGGTNRVSAFVEMAQLNKNLSETEVEACIKFLDFYFSTEMTQRFPEYYNLPLPKQGQPMPEGLVNVPVMLEAASENGTFTITDQAFPTEIADALFNVQDAIANGQMEPADGAKQIQAAIEAYQAK